MTEKNRWSKDDRFGLPPKGVSDAIEKLAAIMARLRAADGCPWDRSMDHQTLRMYLLEETYEVLQALDDSDISELKKELGDLLLQVVFHARLAEERGDFTFTDVTNGIVEKLLIRHPHVFGDKVAHTPSQGVANWEASKQKEGRRLLEGVPVELPALLRAYRVQEKAANVGFDWELPDDAYNKVKEELEELYQASLIAFPRPPLNPPRTAGGLDNDTTTQTGTKETSTQTGTKETSISPLTPLGGTQGGIETTPSNEDLPPNRVGGAQAGKSNDSLPPVHGGDKMGGVPIELHSDVTPLTPLGGIQGGIETTPSNEDLPHDHLGWSLGGKSHDSLPLVNGGDKRGGDYVIPSHNSDKTEPTLASGTELSPDLSAVRLTGMDNRGCVSPKEHWEEELGDVLFSIVNLARKHGVDPESALRKTIDKFHKRFAYIEDRLQEQGRTLQDSTLEEMDRLWEEGKDNLF